MEKVLDVYVANLGKCAEGNLVGEWVSLPADNLEDFLRNEVGIDANYEEYAIHDYQSKFFRGVDEYARLEQLNEQAKKIAQLNEYQQRALAAAVEYYGGEALEWDVSDIVLYDGVTTELELGRYLIDELARLNIPGELYPYFDFERYGRDYSIDCDGGFTRFGFVEYIG